MDVSDIFYFFLLEEGKGAGARGNLFFLKVAGGGFQEGGRVAGRVSVANCGILGGGG